MNANIVVFVRCAAVQRCFPPFKGGFFSESAMCFSNLQFSKKTFQKTILNLKFKFPAKKGKVLLAVIGKFKFQVQECFWNIFFLEIWRFEKRIALSEKNPHLEKFEHVMHEFQSRINLFFI